MAYKLVKPWKSSRKTGGLKLSKRKSLTKKGSAVGTAYGGLSLHRKIVNRSFSGPFKAYSKMKLKVGG